MLLVSLLVPLTRAFASKVSNNEERTIHVRAETAQAQKEIDLLTERSQRLIENLEKINEMSKSGGQDYE